MFSKACNIVSEISYFLLHKKLLRIFPFMQVTWIKKRLVVHTSINMGFIECVVCYQT